MSHQIELAQKLTKAGIWRDINGHFIKEAKENNLVIVIGGKDDLIKFYGAIEGTVEAFDGGTAYITEEGTLLDTDDDDDCSHIEEEKAKCRTITAIWHDDVEQNQPAWTYETDIPHDKFITAPDLDGYVFCEGLVFSL